MSDSEARFRFIDLFAGIGGIRKGFELVGGKCVFTSEWNKYSQQTYRANFPDEHEINGDIRLVNEQDVPEHEILLAGFPCQPFSIAGVSKKNSLGRKHGFECDTQGTLFFDIERILAAKRPKAFLLENVKNLQSHDRGNTFEVIKHVLEDKLGYQIFPKVIDARHWVPQHRERIYIVGFREETGFNWEDLTFPLEGPRLSSILHPELGAITAEPPYTDEQGNVLEKYTLSNKLWQYLQDYAAKHKAKGNGFGYGLFGPNDVARTLSARYYKDGSEVLIEQKGKNPRRLTPRECARLMGFDRPGQDPFHIPVSDTQAYRQFGNAVAVPVIEAIAQAMVPHVMSMSDSSEQKQRSRQRQETLAV